MKKRVLVVDDSRVVYVGLQKLLSDTELELSGYCSRGDEAIEAFGSVMPDIVLMDIMMHGMGWTLPKPAEGFCSGGRMHGLWSSPHLCMERSFRKSEVSAEKGRFQNL